MQILKMHKTAVQKTKPTFLPPEKISYAHSLNVPPVLNCLQVVADYLYFILLSPCKVSARKEMDGTVSVEFAASGKRKVPSFNPFLSYIETFDHLTSLIYSF